MFGDRFSQYIAGVANQFLNHTCTIVLSTATGDEDEEGHPTYTTSEINGVPCMLLWEDVATTDERGTSIVKTPKLYFSRDQTNINEAVLIKNVLNARATNILKSAKIGTIDTTSEVGSESVRVCTLEGAQVN